MPSTPNSTNFPTPGIGKTEITCWLAKKKVGKSMIDDRIVRVPFLVSADERLYVHYTFIRKDEALMAHKGMYTDKLKKIISDEVGEIDPSAVFIEIHGPCVWSGELKSTVSLSEFGLTRDSLEKINDGN